MESLGGLSGHRDQKMFQSIQFVLGIVCVFACFTVFVFSIVSVFAEHAFGGLGGLSGRTGEKCLKVMNLDCTIPVAQSHSSWASVGEALTKLSSNQLIGASDSSTLI